MNRFTATIAFVIFTSILGAGCGHAKLKPTENTLSSNEGSGKGGVVGAIDWFKPKTEAVDIQVMLENKNDFPVYFPSTGIELTVGDMIGTFKFSKFAGSLLPGEQEHALVSFSFKGTKKVYGPAALTFSKFYSDKTKQKIVPLVIKFPMTAEK